jgi:enterochelin esterase-like enzyme
LIASLLVAGVAAASATLVTNRSGQATLAGLAGFSGLFWSTFLYETRGALASTGINGSFDLIGWLVTLLALLTFGVISSWAGATLAQALRPALMAAGSAIRDARRNRRIARSLIRPPLTVAVVLMVLIVTVPVFGDMVNYTPDSRMLHGGGPPAGLIRGTAPELPSQRPWLSWRPSGSGSISIAHLSVPWAGSSATTDVGIYTPPGYDPKGDRPYPVLYEAPTPYGLWDSATNTRVALDTLIDEGAIPATIVVFVNSGGGPYPDTECADSVDGREWMDTFISQTVVSYVDSHYVTIARAGERAIIGFSQGGYCAAILALRHPTVFGTAIPISGYFWAGEGGASSKDPFGGNASALADASPMVAATKLPTPEHPTLFFVVVAQPSQPGLGAQASEFEQLLAVEGYPYLTLDASVPHGWDQVRQEFPAALEAWAAHLVATGMF